MTKSYVSRITEKSSAGQGGFQSTGARIMEISDDIRPFLNDWLKGCRNGEGMPVQPAQIRAIALNVAQDIVKYAA